MTVNKTWHYAAKFFSSENLFNGFSQLESYTGKSRQELMGQYFKHREKTEFFIQSKLLETGRSVVDFYKTTEQYLYELTLQEAQNDYVKKFNLAKNALIKSGGRRALDFGGGIGGLTIFLNKCGFQCDYLDVLEGHTAKYASWRFAQNNVSPALIGHDEALNILKVREYDLITSFDCFEHIFDLPHAIEKISYMLKPGGLLFVFCTFHSGGLHLLINDKYADIFIFNNLLAT